MTQEQAAVNIGLVGVGRWGQVHVQAIQSVPQARLVALCANSAESAAKATADYGLPCDTDFATFLARPEIEAVVIASPNWLHYTMAKQALNAGKHVLCEKPMSFSRQECDDLIATAAQNNRLLIPGHEFRLFTIWEKFREILTSGAIGKPRFGTLELRRYPYSSGSGGWRHSSEKVGDWLLEEPIHYFDLANWFMQDYGHPTRIFAASNAGQPERAAWHENFAAFINFSDGAFITVTRTVASFHFRVRFAFTGSEGTLEATWQAPRDRSPDPVARMQLFRFGDDAPQEIAVEQNTGHVHDLPREIVAFVAAIQGATPVQTGLDARRAVYLCQAAAESLKTGGPVELDDWR